MSYTPHIYLLSPVAVYNSTTTSLCHNFFFCLQIRHRIFSCFPVPELLGISAVSKSWRADIRDFMGKRKCFAFITQSCSEFRSLSAVLADENLSLINALYVDLKSNHVCVKDTYALDTSIHCRELTRLPIRHVHFHVSSCSASQRLMAYVLEQTCNSLEEVRLEYMVC